VTAGSSHTIIHGGPEVHFVRFVTGSVLIILLTVVTFASLQYLKKCREERCKSL
jgi:hypothetical protein